MMRPKLLRRSARFLLCLALLACARAAFATPVYLSPSSLYPSGQYARELLEARTSEARTQRWLRVSAPGGRLGWAPEDLLITSRSLGQSWSPAAGHDVFAPRIALGPNEALAARDGLPLRKAPLPFSETILTLPAGTKVTRVAQAHLRWGQANLKGVVDAAKDGASTLVWWPMADGFGEDGKKLAKVEGDRLTTAELFKRKIFDVATSPVVPGLQLVSAHGVYRTEDGRIWQRVPEFKDANYPLAFARSGAAFVGPFTSVDGGLTFQQFVKWDALIDALKGAYDVDPERMQVLDVRALDAQGLRVRLSLEIGVGQTVAALTEDRGASWTANAPAGLRPMATRLRALKAQAAAKSPFERQAY